jgi:DNA-binding CsgD family transcriptional regulator
MDTKVKAWLNILLFLFLVVVLSFLTVCNFDKKEGLLGLSTLLIISISIRYLLFYENIRLYKFGYIAIIIDGVVIFFLSLLDRHGIVEIYYLALAAEVLIFYPTLYGMILDAVSYCAFITAAFFLNRFTSIYDFAYYAARTLIIVAFVSAIVLIAKYLINENSKLKKVLSSHEQGQKLKNEVADVREGTMGKSLASGALTLRELEIARLMANGYVNKEIAAALYLTEGTVKNYISAIYEKLGTSDRVMAVDLLKTFIIK